MLLGTLISGRNGRTRLGRLGPRVRLGVTLLALVMIALSSGPANASAGNHRRGYGWRVSCPGDDRAGFSREFAGWRL